MTGREYAEQLEADTLSPYAALSRNSRGREHPITPCALRTEFIRDRDRILHCKSFRRLKHKTAGVPRAAGRPLPHAPGRIRWRWRRSRARSRARCGSTRI